jgi:CHAT domain
MLHEMFMAVGFGIDRAENGIFPSCCETHLGTTKITDDILTLGTSFLCAGARTVISSLWAVDDIATTLFCRLYYQNRYLEDNRSLALQKAQANLRFMGSAEFQRNHSKDLKDHLTAYAKAIKPIAELCKPKKTKEKSRQRFSSCNRGGFWPPIKRRSIFWVYPVKRG